MDKLIKLTRKNKAFVSLFLFVVLLAGLLYFTELPNYLFFRDSLINSENTNDFDYFPNSPEYRVTDSINADWQNGIIQASVEQYVEKEDHSYVTLLYTNDNEVDEDTTYRTVNVLMNADKEFWRDYLGDEYSRFINDYWFQNFNDELVTKFDSWDSEIAYLTQGVNDKTINIRKFEKDVFKEMFPKDYIIGFRVLEYYPEGEINDVNCLLLSVGNCISARYYEQNGGYIDLFNESSKEILLIPLSGFILEVI